MNTKPPSNENIDRARAFCREGRFAEGIALFREVTSTDPANAEAHNFLGMALDRTGHSVEALSCFDRAIEIRPDFPDAVANKADALSAIGRFREAVKHYDRALALDPESALIWCNRALALLSLAGGERAKAAELAREAATSARRATELDPAMPEAHLALVRASYQAGDYLSALNASIAALKSGDHPDAKIAFMRSLRSLGRLPVSDELKQFVLKAVLERWDNPRSFARPAVGILTHPASTLGKLIADGEPFWSGEQLAEHAHTLNDPLLLAILEATFLFDAKLEKFLTGIRRSLLAATNSSWQAPEEIVSFAAALALQCFNNEYVYSLSDEEARDAGKLAAAVKEELNRGKVDHFRLAVAGCYAPLSKIVLPELAARDWPKPAAALIERQVREAIELSAIRSTIPAITPIEDKVSQAVRSQYEESPYPRWNSFASLAAPPTLEAFVLQSVPDASLKPLPASRPHQILIAGCGTGQQIARYSNIRDVQVLAIDLSLSSLSFAKLKNAPLKLRHVGFAQADILTLEKASRKFDCIMSTGVLHHLDNPEKGWSVLASMLNPGGVMLVALYSELARKQVVAAREIIRERGIGSTPQDIRKFRDELLALPASAPVHELTRWGDFYSLSECRDLLFHVREHRFTIPRIEKFLQTNGLTFLGFEIDTGTEAAYRRFMPSDRAMRDLSAWHRFEQENPGTFTEMYAFWLQKA